MSAKTGSNGMVQKGHKDGQIVTRVKYFDYRDDTIHRTLTAKPKPFRTRRPKHRWCDSASPHLCTSSYQWRRR